MSRKYLIFPEKFPRFPDSRQKFQIPGINLFFSRNSPSVTPRICGPFWRLFAVSGSFAVGDHLRYCTRVYEVYDPSDAKELSARLLVDDNFPRSGRKYLKTGADLIGSCSKYQLLHLLICGVHSTAYAF